MNLKLFAVGMTMTLSALGALAQPAPQTPRVDQREARQEQRIEKGVASGQLTAHETLRLEKEQTAIVKSEDKAKADGTVTRKERARLQHRQNRASRDIARQKHDQQTVTSGAAAKP